LNFKVLSLKKYPQGYRKNCATLADIFLLLNYLILILNQILSNLFFIFLFSGFILSF